MGKSFIFSAALLITVLSACGTTVETGGGTAQMFSGRVADYSGPAGTLEAQDFSGVNVGAGSINADGRFMLELNETPPDLTGKTIVPEGCPNLSVSDPSVQGVEVTQINVVSKGQSVGNLEQVRIRSNDEVYAATSVTRIYADRDVSIEGRCFAPGTDGEVSIMYTLNYQRGWNVSRSESSSNVGNSGSDVETSTVSASEVRDIGWMYSANPN